MWSWPRRHGWRVVPFWPAPPDEAVPEGDEQGDQQRPQQRHDRLPQRAAQDALLGDVGQRIDERGWDQGSGREVAVPAPVGDGRGPRPARAGPRPRPASPARLATVLGVKTQLPARSPSSSGRSVISVPGSVHCVSSSAATMSASGIESGSGRGIRRGCPRGPRSSPPRPRPATRPAPRRGRTARASGRPRRSRPAGCRVNGRTGTPAPLPRSRGLFHERLDGGSRAGRIQRLQRVLRLVLRPRRWGQKRRSWRAPGSISMGNRLDNETSSTSAIAATTSAPRGRQLTFGPGSVGSTSGDGAGPPRLGARPMRDRESDSLI